MVFSVSTSRRTSRLTSNRNVLSGLLLSKNESNKNITNNDNDVDKVDKYTESKLYTIKWLFWPRIDIKTYSSVEGNGQSLN